MNIWHVVMVGALLVFCCWLVWRTTPRDTKEGPSPTVLSDGMSVEIRLKQIDLFYQSLRDDNIPVRIGSFEIACERLGLVVSLCETVVLVEPYDYRPKECRKYPREHFVIPHRWIPRRTQKGPY